MKGDHDAQTVNVTSTSDNLKAVTVSNTQAIIPDYDEIKDDPGTEKLSGKLHQEEKSVELTKTNNNYFTLMPQEEQESISKVHSYIVHNCMHVYFTCAFQFPNTCAASESGSQL